MLAKKKQSQALAPFEELFQQFLGRPLLGLIEEDLLIPRVDIGETDKEILIETELPGMERKNLEVTVEKDVVTIKAHREAKKERIHRLETSYGRYERSFRLPAYADVAKAKATYENGVLEITVPKAEAATPRKLEVQ